MLRALICRICTSLCVCTRRPRRPDAAVIVAAESDAYVSTESVRQLHRYWEGSELRLVSGGHGELALLQNNHLCMFDARVGSM